MLEGTKAGRQTQRRGRAAGSGTAPGCEPRRPARGLGRGVGAGRGVVPVEPVARASGRLATAKATDGRGDRGPSRNHAMWGAPLRRERLGGGNEARSQPGAWLQEWLKVAETARNWPKAAKGSCAGPRRQDTWPQADPSVNVEPIFPTHMVDHLLPTRT